MFDRHVPEMDATALVGALRDCAWDERVAQNRQLVLAAQWAVVHDPEGLPRAGSGPVNLVGERAVRMGGPGTPLVREFAAAELAPEIGLSVYQAQSLIEDAQDLKHRFPLIWRQIRAGRVRAFVARQIARRTRDLPLVMAKRIDELLVGKIINLPPKRVEHLVDAAILKVDPERVRKLVEDAKRARFVEFSHSTEHGIRGMYARMDAPDAARLKAMIKRMADILINSEPIPGVRYGHAQTRREWEVVALNVLGDPALAFRILVEHDQPELFSALADLFTPDPDAPLSEEAPSDPDREPPAEESEPDPETLPPDDLDQLPDYLARSQNSDAGGAADGPEAEAVPPVPAPAWDPALEAAKERALRALVKQIDPAKLVAPVTLYVHLTDAALSSAAGPCTGADGDAPVARVEGVGPVLLDQLAEWLCTGSRIRVVPVVDPGCIPPVDAYEFPDRMREALWLRTPASVFPYSANTSRSMDINHTDPYRAGGKGQTGLHNAGPIGRSEHRFLTHGRISVRQPSPGVYVYRTMYGRVLITNPTGTFDLGTGEWATAIWQFSDGSTPTVAA